MGNLVLLSPIDRSVVKTVDMFIGNTKGSFKLILKNTSQDLIVNLKYNESNLVSLSGQSSLPPYLNPGQEVLLNFTVNGLIKEPIEMVITGAVQKVVYNANR